ncbi:MAG TPA: PQQ-dependent sugar dehydrogenase [Steroidobacteraceae bacterium]|nr:PQQ-dependent sugar dehydrogenase [Steroidobacteraceae bacterium]
MKRRVIAFGLLSVVPIAWAQQPPNIGIAPVTLTESAYVFDTAEQHKIRVTVVAKGLVHPFSVAVLPSGDALVSERGMQLRLVHNATGANGRAPTLDPQPIKGIPPLEPAYRNGGLHDIVLHPQFAQNKLVYFTFNEPGNPPPPDAKPPIRRESRVALFRGRLNGTELTKVQELFVGESGSTSGSRLAFGKDGTLYMTTGAPFGGEAQELDSVYGKVLRFNDDGTVPADNPFAGKSDARPQIFSLGHRDQLGLTVHPLTGAVLNAEHGPNGGDEVNVILPGRNYGWPKVTFGRNYDGTRLSEAPVAEGVEQPTIVWLPSIGPSGLTVYTGDRLPAWKGNLFVGSVRRGEVPRTGGLERIVLNDNLGELRRETLLTELHQRIRDVRQGPDGLLYVLTDEDDGALLRIEPAS